MVNLSGVEALGETSQVFDHRALSDMRTLDLPASRILSAPVCERRHGLLLGTSYPSQPQTTGVLDGAAPAGALTPSGHLRHAAVAYRRVAEMSPRSPRPITHRFGDRRHPGTATQHSGGYRSDIHRFARPSARR